MKKLHEERRLAISNICEEYICPVCMPKGTDLKQHIYCKKRTR